MVAGLRCPPPPSSSPIPCSPIGLDLPRPHPVPPASSRASPPGPRPTICRPSPTCRVSIWGLRNPRRVTLTCLGGVRLGTDSAWRCSAYDWLRVPWAGLGEKRDAVTPPTLYKSVLSLGLFSRRGALGRARSLACLPRGGGAQGALRLSRHHPLLLPQQLPKSLPSCPRRGLVPSPPNKDGAVGADPHFKQSYNREKFGFTRNVGDCLLYISTFHSTK